MLTEIDFEKIVRVVGRELNDCLEPKDAAFFKRVYGGPIERYGHRLKSIGFEGYDYVLDAGAGFGQWSLALAELNSRVAACDVSKERVDAIDLVKESLGVYNVDARKCSLTELPFEDETFDAVFCYGTIMCTPWKESIKELYRVMRPGGRIYLTANGFGYQVYIWIEQPNRSATYSPRLWVPQTLKNTLEYQAHGTPQEGAQIIIEPEELLEFLKGIGLIVRASGGEGTIDLTHGDHQPIPFFPDTYLGLTCCHEALAEKIAKGV